jgi:GNAT superfamily N-acetyltransferase
VRAHLVKNEIYLRASPLVNAEVWNDHRELTEAEFLADLAEVSAGLEAWSAFRVVVSESGQMAATGGCTIVGDVARLWGAGTRAAFRWHGLYRVLLAARMALAREHGATLALVKGRAETSGPILRRCGFAAYGEDRLYCLLV